MRNMIMMNIDLTTPRSSSEASPSIIKDKNNNLHQEETSHTNVFIEKFTNLFKTSIILNKVTYIHII